MHYLYLLLLKNKKIYTGVTDDLKRRMQEHKNGKVISTKNIRPIRLIHYEAYLFKSDALRREKYLKTTEGKRFLKQQLKDLMKELKI